MESKLLSCPHPLWEETLRQVRHDAYHSQGYALREAARTGTTAQAFLLKEGDRLFFLPYLLRSCRGIPMEGSPDGEVYDAVSPYGYPGPLLSPIAHEDAAFQQFAVAELKRAFRERGICSAFVRLHPILNEGDAGLASLPESRLLGHTISVDLKLTDPMIWANTRKGHKSTINRCIRSGFAARMVPVAPYLAEFMSVYRETMTRVGARESYRFSTDYLRSLVDLSPLLHLCVVECKGEIASACLFLECGGIVQAHLGGTRTRFLGASPFSLLFDFGRHWAKIRGNEYFHLGGGLAGQDGDPLFAFKRGFSERRHGFRVLRLITDEGNYARLVKSVAMDLRTDTEPLIPRDFFPAYRSPE